MASNPIAIRLRRLSTQWNEFADTEQLRALHWLVDTDEWRMLDTFFTLESLVFKTRYQIKKGVRARWDIWREIVLYPSFDKIAFKILDENPDVNAVIFGHTHILAYRQYREGKEYFNEGTWNEVTNLHLSETPLTDCCVRRE